MADISKIQVGSTTYDIKDKAQHSDLTTTTKTFVGGINELKSSKQEKIYFTEPSSPKNGDIWIDEDDHTGEEIPITNAGQVTYDDSLTYPDGTVGKKLQESSHDTEIRDLVYAILPDLYSSTKSYVTGDLCIYDNKLYQCVSATTGSWDSTKWQQKKIGNVAILNYADVV